MNSSSRYCYDYDDYDRASANGQHSAMARQIALETTY